MTKKTNCRIIIIDEDKATVNSLKKMLKCSHSLIDDVNNEIAALDKIVQHDYDYYFISDSINKLTLITLIKEINIHPKIIVMSSNSSLKSEEHIRSYGITYLLKKPFLQKEVREIITPGLCGHENN